MPPRNFRIAALGGMAALLLTAGAVSAQSSKAELKGKDGKIIGTATVTATGAGSLVAIKAEGLGPGAHAVRFFDTGKCEGDFTSAGSIYNPLGAKHGLLNEDGPMSGDLPNVFAAADGKAEAELLTPLVHLASDEEAKLLDEDGAAILIFEKGDDHLTDPGGGAGAAIACGVLDQPK
jgi:Cu-Zn family superoxide dismutase